MVEKGIKGKFGVSIEEILLPFRERFSREQMCRRGVREAREGKLLYSITRDRRWRSGRRQGKSLRLLEETESFSRKGHKFLTQTMDSQGRSVSSIDNSLIF